MYKLVTHCGSRNLMVDILVTLKKNVLNGEDLVFC